MLPPNFATGFSIFSIAETSPSFGIYHSYAIRFLDSEIDVMEDTAALPAGAEGHTETAIPRHIAGQIMMTYRVIVRINRKVLV